MRATSSGLSNCTLDAILHWLKIKDLCINEGRQPGRNSLLLKNFPNQHEYSSKNALDASKEIHLHLAARPGNFRRSGHN
jgi:hypothetical protein